MYHPLLAPSDRFSLLAVIDPDANAAGTLDTGWIDVALYESFLAIILAGDLGTNATLDVKLRQAKDSSGTDAKDITGKAITQMTQAGTNMSNKQTMINLESEDLDNGFSYISLRAVGATATSDFAALLIGLNGKYGKSHAATVLEVV
jgi:hypothetical protein